MPIEEHVQRLFTSLLDLAGIQRDPASLGAVQISNLMSHAISHLAGHDGQYSRLLRATSAGELVAGPVPWRDLILGNSGVIGADEVDMAAIYDYTVVAGHTTNMADLVYLKTGLVTTVYDMRLPPTLLGVGSVTSTFYLGAVFVVPRPARFILFGNGESDFTGWWAGYRLRDGS